MMTSSNGNIFRVTGPLRGELLHIATETEFYVGGAGAGGGAGGGG